MSYEYQARIRWSFTTHPANDMFGEEEPAALKELDHVYSQASKADEYEAKVKVLDRVKDFAEEPPFLLANNENEDYERYAYEQILKLINKYESGDRNES